MKTESIGIAQNPYKDIPSPPAKPGKVFDKKPSDIFEAPVDTYTPSIVEGTADPAKIEKLWKETDHMGDAVRKLINSAIGIKDKNGQGFWALRTGNYKLSEADRAYAQELISEDGYFGVKKTTERIMDFAKALVGEGASEEQIENMRAAVQKGFDEVAKMFGGFDKLPDVTKDTYNAIMAAFDSWLGKDSGTSENETSNSAESSTAADTE